LFDAYLLKSLDGAATAPDATGSVFIKCGPDATRTCLFIKHEDSASSRKRPQHHSPKGVDPLKVPMVHVGVYSTSDPWAVALTDELLQAGIGAYCKTEPEHSRMNVRVSGREVNKGGAKVAVLAEGVLSSNTRYFSVLTSALKQNLTLTNLVVELARRGGTPDPLMFDHVIRCLGWRHQKDMYTDQTRPRMQYNGKYPVMTAEYESANVPGMYFAGQLSHGKDHLKSAGGFIHGFRYTARALFRILDAKYFHDKPYAAPTMWSARCAFSDRNLHSRMPLDPTHVRLKRTRV
jgi:hypothetical protein